jgi:hypothetical protein
MTYSLSCENFGQRLGGTRFAGKIFSRRQRQNRMNLTLEYFPMARVSDRNLSAFYFSLNDGHYSGLEQTFGQQEYIH